MLAVGDLGPDGFHRVSTLLQAVGLFDHLTAVAAAGLRLSCAAAEAPAGPANLAWRAAEVLARRAGRRADVHLALRKSIPAGAGLGGASADAAAALVACNRLWRAGLRREELEELAAGLGADVPFFLWGGTARGEGRGERITPLPPLPAWPCLVAVPAERKPSTAAAYAALDRLGSWPRPAVGPALSPRRPHELAAAMGNSFEVLGRPPLPVSGALGTVLAGSGTGLFSLAPSVAWARRAAAQLRSGGWFARACRLWPRGAEVLP